MSKYVTGFCSQKLCEGTRPVSPSGKPMKVCVAIDICTCECHVRFTEMFDLAKTARIVYQNPDYVPHDSGIFEFLEEYEKKKGETLLTSSRVVEEKPVTADDGTVMLGLARSGKVFEPTKRGRAAGQLEDEIRGICNRFLQQEWPDQELCTPKFVAQQIFLETDAPAPPSVGAVGAAFDRWERIGFAIIQRNPVRFSTFTVRGFTEGLEAMKLAAKVSGVVKLRSAR